MATQAQLEEGIRRAHAAGRTDDAKALGTALRAMTSGGEAAAAPEASLVDRVTTGTKAAAAEIAKDPAWTGSARVDPFQRSRQLNAAMISGATLGYGDEIAGAIKGGIDYVANGFDSAAAERGYETGRDSMRNDRAAFAERAPVAEGAIELSTGLGAFVPAATAAVGRAGANFGSRLLAGAGLGAAYGGVQGFGEGEGGLQSRLLGGAIGAGVGGTIGGVAEGLSTGIARGLRSRQASQEAPLTMVDATGQPTQDAIDMAVYAGIDPNAIDADVLQRLDNVAQRGGRPGVPGTRELLDAELLPVAVPIRRGQATDNFEQKAEEYALERGGGPAGGMMRDQARRTDAALSENIPAFQGRIAGGQPLIERGQGGARAQDRLVSMEAERRAEANRLYDEARTLDRAGEDSRVPFAPIDETDDAFNRADPSIEPDIRRAENDVRLARGQQDGTRKAIIRRIQELGGIRTLDPRGNPLSEAGDLRAIFDKSTPPGLVNNKGGRDLDKIREALGEEGWFGNRDPQTVSTQDLLEMISNRSGHPDSVRGDWRLQRDQTAARDELQALGVKRRTPEDEAAQRLAMSRTSERNDPIERVEQPRELRATAGPIAAKEFGPRLYRETSGLDALEILPHSNAGRGRQENLFMSNDRDLALGQGDNQGVMVTFDSGDLQGFLNTRKPGSAVLAKQGKGEIVASPGYEGDLRNSVVEVEIPDWSAIDRRARSPLENTLRKMDESGEWDVVQTATGAIARKRSAGAESDARSIAGAGPDGPQVGPGVVDLPESDGPIPATGFRGDDAGRILGGIYGRLRDDSHVLRDLPRVGAALRALTQEVGDRGALPVGKVFESLKRFAAIQRENFGTEQAVAAGKVKQMLERELDAGLEQGLLQGDEEVIGAYRRARSNYREFADTFKRNDMVGALVARDPKRGFELKHSPEEAANFIFNTSDLGLTTKKNVVRDLRRMRDILGPESEEWNAIRQEAFLRIASKSLGEQTQAGPRAFSAAKLATAWEDFSRRNRELAAEMFSAAERRDIGNWIETARRVTITEKNLRAPSTSADQMKRELSKRLQKRVPFTGKFVDLWNNALDARKARDAISGRLRRPEATITAPDTRRAGREIPGSIIAGSTLLGPQVGAQGRQ